MWELLIVCLFGSLHSGAWATLVLIYRDHKSRVKAIPNMVVMKRQLLKPNSSSHLLHFIITLKQLQINNFWFLSFSFPSSFLCAVLHLCSKYLENKFSGDNATNNWNVISNLYLIIMGTNVHHCFMMFGKKHSANQLKECRAGWIFENTRLTRRLVHSAAPKVLSLLLEVVNTGNTSSLLYGISEFPPTQ